MDIRKQNLLKVIIEEYVKEAVPIGSKLLVEKHKLDYSSATARNIMLTLEEDGYLMHPHTSAGRIPTEKGYQFYIEHFMKDAALSKDHEKALKNTLANSTEDHVKDLAKSMAEIANQAVFVGFSPRDFYYTGLSNLFRKPEFGDVTLVINMSKVIDHFDEVVAVLFDDIDDAKVLIGSQNPFAAECSLLVSPYTYKKSKGIFGILGPMRMNYGKNYAALKTTKALLEHAT